MWGIKIKKLKNKMLLCSKENLKTQIMLLAKNRDNLLLYVLNYTESVNVIYSFFLKIASSCKIINCYIFIS